MWNFIRYCLYCMGIAISGSFGHNPDGLTWKTALIGVATLIVVGFLAIGLLFLIAFLVKVIKRG